MQTPPAANLVNNDTNFAAGDLRWNYGSQDVFKQERYDADICYAVIVGPQPFVASGYHNLSEEVPGVHERQFFLSELFIRIEVPGRLDIDFADTGIDDEVISCWLVTFFPSVILFIGTIVEYDIFHKMSGILLPKIELCIPKSEVHGVIFLRIAEIFLAFDVIAFCMMHQERVFNVIDVCLYGVVRCSPLHECRRRVCKVMRVRERTD